MRIAFFDSGIGGITVMFEAIKQLPKEDFLYFADTLHVPYGTKTKEEVKKYVINSIHTILKEEVKAIVIACNTATSIAVSELRSEFNIPIIGMEPAVKPAVEMNRTNGKRVLVFATPLTLSQTRYVDLISRVDDQRIVDSLPLPELVEFCERLNVNHPVIVDYFKEKLSNFNLEIYGTIVLGCTHYPFYKQVLRNLLPNHIQIIDGSKGTINRLKQELTNRGQLNLNGSSSVKYLCSSEDSDYLLKMSRALTIFAEVDDCT
jgi:glutamate racemase